MTSPPGASYRGGGLDLTDEGGELGFDGRSGHEYGDGPPSRWTQPWSSRSVTVATALAALLVGFLLAAGLVAGRVAAVEQHARKGELIALVHARQERADALSAQLEELRAQVAAAESAATSGVPALEAGLAQVQAAAGLTGLRGPGLTVELADAGERCAAPDAELCKVQDTDLQRTVNTLFALGAEGVAVNGERVIATTAIRSAGGAILVNYRVLTSPYEIEAVGHADTLADGFADSQLGVDLAEWSTFPGLGYTTRTASELELPPFTGSVRMRTARVDEGGR